MISDGSIWAVLEIRRFIEFQREREREMDLGIFFLRERMEGDWNFGRQNGT